MYSIYADGQCVYNDRYPLEAYAVISPTLKMADSAAGSLEMTLPPVNRAYEELKRMKSQIVVKRYDEDIWEGRIVEDTYDFQNNRKVYCEGALAYFNDTCQPQREYSQTTLTNFLQSVIDIHNSKVPDNRKIYFDYQNVEGGVLEYRATQYQKTMEVLNSVCTDYDCHMKLTIKKVQTDSSTNPETGETTPIYERRRLISFFKGVIGSSPQTVEFGKNLLDYTKNFDMSNLATVVLPLGAVKERANNSGIGDAIDLTKVIPYNTDNGYGVEVPMQEFTYINFKSEVEAGHDIIVNDSTYVSYWTAKIKVRASDSTKERKVYISSRMHGGRGMYVFLTPNSTDYHSGKFSAEPIGFTDMIEEAVTVPYINSEQAAGEYEMWIGSFGGDIQLRVNMPAEVSDKLDEYYTAEDALVSTINLVDAQPTFEQGTIARKSEPNEGQPVNPVDAAGRKFARTVNFIQNSSSQDGGFPAGTYSIKLSTTSEHNVQAIVLQYVNGQSSAFENSSNDWLNLPARFEVPSSHNVKLKLMLRYSDSSEDFDPTCIENVIIMSGEKYGSLYVTAQSRNLFNDIIEQGSIIDSGPMIGESSSGHNPLVMRNTKKLLSYEAGSTAGDLQEVGFDSSSTYCLSGTVSQPGKDSKRQVDARIFAYDYTNPLTPFIGIYEDPTTHSQWNTLPVAFNLSQFDSQSNSMALRFEFKMHGSENLVLTQPAYENGDINVSTGALVPDSSNKTARTIFFVQNGRQDSPNPFGGGSYVVSASTSTQHTLQAKILQYEYSNQEFVTGTDWADIPANFIISNDKAIQIKVVFRYKDSDDPIDLTVDGVLSNFEVIANASVMTYGVLNDIMLEQGVTTPSLYEPPNTSYEEYGWIETALTFDNVTSPDELYYRAKSYLASGQFDKMTLDVTALDLSVLGVDPGALDVNNYIRVKSAPHGLDKFFEITSIDIPLAEPENMQFRLGSETQQTLTSINNNQINELTEKFENQTSISQMIDSARINAERIIEEGFGSGEMVVITKNGIASGLGFFRAWVDPSDHSQGTEWYGPIPTSEWSEIISDQTLSQVMCLLINTEGIAFYGAGLGNDSTITLANGLGQIVADSILTGSMVAERILGGTLHLGIAHGGTVPSDSQQDDSGKLYMHCSDPSQLDQNGNIKYLNNNRMIEITKDVGIIQQGFHSDGYTRQVRIDKGTIEGSVLHDSTVHQGDDAWHVGGTIRMATKWDHSSPYGIEISSPNGPMAFTPGSAGVTILSSGGQQTWGYDNVVNIGSLKLHFTHGWLTYKEGEYSGGGGGSGGDVSRNEFDSLVSKYNNLIDLIDQNANWTSVHTTVHNNPTIYKY